MRKIVLEVILMSKDYREKIEEHRQSIEAENQTESRLARSRRPVKKNKKRTSSLMTGLVVVFIFIPLIMLIYVWGFYEPQETQIAKVDDENTVVQVEKNNTVSASNDKEKDVVEENQDKNVEKPAEEQKTTDNSEELKKQQAELEAKKAELQAKAAKEAEQRKAAEQAKQQKALEAQKQQREQEKVQQQQTNGQTVHTVGANENLFRIALKYFNGDPNGVQKIKDANNLTSDNISVGQQLIIPQ